MDKSSGIKRADYSCHPKDKTVAKNRKPIRTSEELVQAFADLFDEIPVPDAPEEVDAILREFGYDPDKLAERMRAAAERAMAASPLSRQSEGLKERNGGILLRHGNTMAAKVKKRSGEKMAVFVIVVLILLANLFVVSVNAYQRIVGIGNKWTLPVIIFQLIAVVGLIWTCWGLWHQVSGG